MKTHTALLLGASMGLCLNTGAATAQDIDWSGQGEAIDAIFADITAENLPGCAVGVIHAGELVHRAGYGVANLEHGIAITPDSIFRTGSLAKQFTAMAVAVLAERGDLDLDADIHTYLPDLMDYGQEVTVRQMIHHVAGMADYEGERTHFQNAVGGPFRWGNEDYLSISEFYEIVATVPLAIPAGTEYRYSNYAYFLLSQLVERVSGQSLREFAQLEIFDRLDMTDSFFNDRINDIVANRVDGYRLKENGEFEISMTNLAWVGDGGVYTSINDFLKWDQNFYDNQLGNQTSDLIDTVTTPHSITPREDVGYGFGMNIGEYNDHRVVYHTGSWVGYTSFYSRFPDLNASIVAFCSNAEISAPRRAIRMTEIFLGSEAEE